MMRARISGLLILVLAGYGGFAQSNTASHHATLRVIGMASLALNDTRPISLNLFVPSDGSAPIGEVSTQKRLKYTTINPPGVTRRVQVSAIGTIPRGTALRVEAITGTPGIGTAVLGGVSVSEAEQDIITNIPSCYTRQASEDGVALRYSFEAVDPSAIEIDSTADLSIRYTITDG